MTGRMLPVPPASRSSKGTGSSLNAGQDTSVHRLKADDAAEQGETAHGEQNSTNKGYFVGDCVR